MEKWEGGQNRPKKVLCNLRTGPYLLYIIQMEIAIPRNNPFIKHSGNRSHCKYFHISLCCQQDNFHNFFAYFNGPILKVFYFLKLSISLYRKKNILDALALSGTIKMGLLLKYWIEIINTVFYFKILIWRFFKLFIILF